MRMRNKRREAIELVRPGLRPLLNAADVARILKCSRRQAYQWMATGELPAVRKGRLVRVREEDLREFIEAGRVVA